MYRFLEMIDERKYCILGRQPITGNALFRRYTQNHEHVRFRRM